MAPGDIPVRIAQWYEDRGVPLSSDPVVVVSHIVDSLAVAIASAVHTAGELAGITVREICLVGGGSQNSVLAQRLANQSGIPVVAGPVEATALGNILVQARSAGLISGDLESLRALVRHCSHLTTFEPQT
jgi:rhamnulokinase